MGFGLSLSGRLCKQYLDISSNWMWIYNAIFLDNLRGNKKMSMKYQVELLHLCVKEISVGLRWFTHIHFYRNVHIFHIIFKTVFLQSYGQYFHVCLKSIYTNWRQSLKLKFLWSTCMHVVLEIYLLKPDLGHLWCEKATVIYVTVVCFIPAIMQHMWVWAAVCRSYHEL